MNHLKFSKTYPLLKLYHFALQKATLAKTKWPVSQGKNIQSICFLQRTYIYNIPIPLTTLY